MHCIDCLESTLYSEVSGCQISIRLSLPSEPIASPTSMLRWAIHLASKVGRSSILMACPRACCNFGVRDWDET